MSAPRPAPHCPDNRFYRRHAPRPDERSFQVVVEQSDLWVTVRADAPPGLEDTALKAVNDARAVISAWMLLDPAFAASLVPVSAPDSAPDLIRRMCRAAAVMGVGPTATLAGAVAECAAAALLPFSPDCIVENGGDSVMHSTRERLVAVLPHPEEKAVIGLRFAQEAFPLALCASSAVFGHSLSFGRGDLAVALAKDACLADAAATAFCNMLKGPDDVPRALEKAEALAPRGIAGLFVQCGGNIGVWGDMELASLDM